MIEFIDLQILENITGEKNKGNLNRVFQNLFNKIEGYLDLKPYHRKVKVVITKNKALNISKSEDIFSIGVNNNTVACLCTTFTKFKSLKSRITTSYSNSRNIS